MAWLTVFFLMFGTAYLELRKTLKRWYRAVFIVIVLIFIRLFMVLFEAIFQFTYPQLVEDVSRIVWIITVGFVPLFILIIPAIIHKEKKELLFAGAINPLYLIRKSSVQDEDGSGWEDSLEQNDFQLLELRGDRQPIGIHWEENAFSTQRMKLMDSLINSVASSVKNSKAAGLRSFCWACKMKAWILKKLCQIKHLNTGEEIWSRSTMFVLWESESKATHTSPAPIRFIMCFLPCSRTRSP